MTSPERSGPAELALSRGTVDRVTHRRNDADWLDRAWKDPGTRVLVVLEGAGPGPRRRRSGPELIFLQPEQAPPGTRFLLGQDSDGVVYFGVSGPLPDWPQGRGRRTDDPRAGHGVHRAALRDVGAVLSDRDAGLAHPRGGAGQLARHAYALPARTALRHGARPGRAFRSCPVDGSEHFPRTDPAVIMLVTDPRTGACWPATPAGRAAASRSWPGSWNRASPLEQAVIREVAEETGIIVTNVRYVASQPWPMPRSLMLGFRAEAMPGEVIAVDQDELTEAHWYSRADLLAAVTEQNLGLPGPVSIARHIIEAWYGGPLPA